MSDELQPNSGEYVLVMPFVVCSSNGGPYDDQSFVAGARYGDLSRLLRSLPPEITTLQHTEYIALLPQLELLAMHEGWAILFDHLAEEMARDAGEAWPDEWAVLTFHRLRDDGEAVEA